MSPNAIEILEEARQALEKGGVGENDRKELLTLLDVLVSAIETTGDNKEDSGELSRSLATSLVSSQALLTLLKQQTAELDTLRKLSLNLTSSLDMPTVLDALTHEAMGLVEDAYAVHIFLYRNGTLEFGSGLQADGSTKVIAMPRQNGVTYTVARQGETLVVEDIGSTAVPGCAGRGVIDLMILYSNEPVEPILDKLDALGFQWVQRANNLWTNGRRELEPSNIADFVRKSLE